MSVTSLATLLVRVSDWIIQDSWTNDPPQPPSTRVSAFDASFPGTLPVRTPERVPNPHPRLSFNFRFLEAESDMRRSWSQGRTSLELKRPTPIYF